MIKLSSKKLIDPDNDLTNIDEHPISEDGNFGIVYKGVYHKRTGGKDESHDCAIKKLKISPKTSQEYDAIFREISSQNLLKHPALLPLDGFYLPFFQKGQCIIVTPFMKNGSLRRLLREERKSRAPEQWNETTRAINIFGIATGMCYMHQQKLLHRDLKTGNVLLNDKLYPQICDFGCSKIFEDGLDAIVTATCCGTPVYMAPELLKDEDYNSKVDVFAYASILYELLTLHPAYEGLKPSKYLCNIRKGKMPTLDDRFPDFFKKLLQECWAFKPGDRPAFVDIVNRILTAYNKKEIFADDQVNRDTFDDYAKEVLKPLKLDVVPDI